MQKQLYLVTQRTRKDYLADGVVMVLATSKADAIRQAFARFPEYIGTGREVYKPEAKIAIDGIAMHL